MKKPGIKYFIELTAFAFLLILISCSTGKSVTTNGDDLSTDRMTVINKPMLITGEIVFEKEVTIYPQAFIATKGNGHITFKKRVNILGESQVFDQEAKITFGFATTSTLNPCWFGAKGYDDQDDTRPFQKVLEMAKQYENSVNIEVPVGVFKINETLQLGNQNPNGKSINLIGKSQSVGSENGSVMEWIGMPGKSMLVISNSCVNTIEKIDFLAGPDHLMRHNVELRPYDYQVSFRDCTFSSCAGAGSANINLNKDNNAQVSEIQFQNCTFHGYTNDNKTWKTESAVIGGRANTKNFSFTGCSFLGYSISAINIDITDILRVDHCTFALNEVDITCMLCNTFATSNYSEQSKAFFLNGVSGNPAFTTFSNNYFDGNEKDDYFIRDGSGGLILLNNNFGGNGGDDQVNKIKWDDKSLSNIFSVNNYFRNNPQILNPFVNRNFREHNLKNISSGDKIGPDGEHVKVLKGE